MGPDIIHLKFVALSLAHTQTSIHTDGCPGSILEHGQVDIVLLTRGRGLGFSLLIPVLLFSGRSAYGCSASRPSGRTIRKTPHERE
jgi:hypothetical protein